MKIAAAKAPRWTAPTAAARTVVAPAVAAPAVAAPAIAVAALLALLALAGCATTHPSALPKGTLAEAQTFPYYRVYWVGARFGGRPLAAVDGRRNYNSTIGDSVYYGDCVTGKGLLGGGGSCVLPLQVTTVVYRLHSNGPLGPQRNALIDDVPATIYDGGRSIELYSGRLAIDVFSDTPSHALLAATKLKPLNAPAKASASLPPPVYCPGLAGPVQAPLRQALDSLPGHPCQRTDAAGG